MILDTGVLLAALDDREPSHDACTRLVSNHARELVVPAPVLGELDYFLHKRAPEAEWTRFCEELAAGAYSLFSPSAEQVAQAARVQAKYADLPLGFVDASVLVACEALEEERVATLDHRHFSVLRTSRGRPLTLLP